jgi:hypothetical protein
METVLKKDISRLDFPSSKLTGMDEETWISLSVLSEHWQSDLAFFKDELRFLRSLINKYFIWLMEEENIEKTRLLAKGITEMETQRNSFDQQVATHLQHLQRLIENPFAYDAHAIKQEHEKLENNISQFVKDFRVLKRETFDLTELVIESEKAQHLLKGNLA